MIRKLLSGLLAGLLTVSLCACGGDDTRGEDSQREAHISHGRKMQSLMKM